MTEELPFNQDLTKSNHKIFDLLQMRSLVCLQRVSEGKYPKNPTKAQFKSYDPQIMSDYRQCQEAEWRQLQRSPVGEQIKAAQRCFTKCVSQKSWKPDFFVQGQCQTECISTDMSIVEKYALIEMKKITDERIKLATLYRL